MDLAYQWRIRCRIPIELYRKFSDAEIALRLCLGTGTQMPYRLYKSFRGGQSVSACDKMHYVGLEMPSGPSVGTSHLRPFGTKMLPLAGSSLTIRIVLT
jgi:hypothetical protein